jgi:hypothetical protein
MPNSSGVRLRGRGRFVTGEQLVPGMGFEPICPVGQGIPARNPERRHLGPRGSTIAERVQAPVNAVIALNHGHKQGVSADLESPLAGAWIQRRCNPAGLGNPALLVPGLWRRDTDGFVFGWKHYRPALTNCPSASMSPLPRSLPDSWKAPESPPPGCRRPLADCSKPSAVEPSGGSARSGSKTPGTAPPKSPNRLRSQSYRGRFRRWSTWPHPSRLR